mmetsp:Transcript_18916/g.35685  ORF Transcript_18916/g.35685 Transcript_18916/m.35685 type:complete len:378 (-) Transcript_18916:241-1374(-)
MVSVLLGYVGIVMAMVFFGSNFIIVKKFDSGDGVFFQLWMCMGIWTVGLVVNLMQGSPKFWPFAMLGGALWATGNVLCVYVIQQIGMGLGLVIWGSMAMLVGWFTGFFGLFGLQKDELSVVWLNVLGLVFALGSLFTSFFVRVTHQPNKNNTNNNNPNSEGFVILPGSEQGESKLVSVQEEYYNMADNYNSDTIDGGAGAGASPKQASNVQGNRLWGIIFALCAGFFFGNNFDPPTYIQQHNCDDGNKCMEMYRGASSDPLDYVFAHFCGILLMAFLIFFTYTVVKRNNPWVSPQICFPAYLSGMMWALGQVGWFMANSSLGYTVAFPLAVIGPGIIGSMWSVFVFKEIRGLKNYLLLCGVFGFAICTAVCIVMSKH